MKIFYDPQTGEIYYVVKDVDYPYFTHSTNIPLEIVEREGWVEMPNIEIL